MRLRRSALSFLLLTGLSLALLSPAQAAEKPTPAPAPAHQLRAGVAEKVAAKVSEKIDKQIDQHADAVAEVEALAPADDTAGDAADDAAEDQAGNDAGQDAGKTPAPSGPITPGSADRDTTLDLRDAFLKMNTLSPANQKVVAAAYKRPWMQDGPTSAPKCGTYVCVHWLSAQDATDPADVSTPQWAATVLKVVDGVAASYRKAGYRPLPSDGNFGGNNKTDIYLYGVGGTNQDPTGLYGYCTIDSYDGAHATFPTPGTTAYPAFCALDNNYNSAKFPTGRAPIDSLKVTAAHEYFHAVQFAYDYFEDRWFMEATATWAEDELFTTINDNRQYLPRSQLRYPGVSLDTFNGAGGFAQYGDWLFFRYLTERLPATYGGLPVLMRRMWEYADSVRGPDYYSIQAVVAALREKHVAFDRMFARYAAANQHPASSYREGRAYPSGKVRRTVRLKPGKRTASGTYRINHLAYATTRFVPKRLPSTRTKLTLSVDMANKKSGSVAMVLVFAKNGRITTKMVKLGKAGNGKVRVPFSSRKVRRVELLLVNANHAYKRCWVRSPYSCSGIPARNNVKERFKARVS